MIDLHTHLLPKVDDGASSVEEAFDLIRMLSEQKVPIAVCTPHFDPTRTALSEFVKERQMALSLLNNPVIQLITGSETKLHAYLFHYPELSELCISNTNYLLLELPFTKHWDSEVYEWVNRLISYYNIIPIIAHIERYPAIKRSNRPIKKLMKMGCILQLNTSSLLERHTRHRAIRYLKKGYISVLGSDCHNRNERPPRITPALDIIIRRVGSEALERLLERAEQIFKEH